MPKPKLTAEQRRLRAQIAANTRWANADPVAGTAEARQRFLDRFAREVDPNGTLTAEERARRARSALSAHMQRLAFRSSKVRARRRGGPDVAA